MNIYVETNFVLELTFEQEQSSSCQNILQLCESRQAALIIPAYSLAEPHEKLSRQAKKRQGLQQALNIELNQLIRTASYANRVRLQEIASLLLQSNEEDQQRFHDCRERILGVSEVVALTPEILKLAATCERLYDLAPQDAIVYASVLQHLRSSEPEKACFLNRNSKDFDNPDIINAIGQFNCRMIPRFDHGLSYLQAELEA